MKAMYDDYMYCSLVSHLTQGGIESSQAPSKKHHQVLKVLFGLFMVAQEDRRKSTRNGLATFYISDLSRSYTLYIWSGR